MTWWDKSFLGVAFLGVIVIQCLWQAELIKRHMRIRHGLHAVYYALPACLMLWFFWPHWWQIAVIAIAERWAFFDPVLNAVRKKSFWYNGAGGSIQDRIENKWNPKFLNAMKIFYIVLFVALFIIIK